MADSAVNLNPFECWGNVPYMVESDVGKFATPLGGDTATEKQGQQFVAKVLPELEAAIGQFPHAVDTVGAIRFTKDIVEEQSL